MSSTAEPRKTLRLLNTNRFFNTNRFLAPMMALLLATAACDTDTGTQPGDDPGPQPDLPTQTSMNVDFGLFSSGGGPALARDLTAAAASSQLNFGTAALTVVVAQAVTALHLAVPAAVFAVAANNTPSFEDDGRWHWRYTASHQGQLWTAHLSGAVDGNQVSWDMRITAPQSDPPLDEFLWYGGASRTDGTSGTWRFNDPSNPAGSNEVARVDWTHVSADDHSVTITVTGGDNVGDVLIAEHTGDERFVTWTDASNGNTVEIWWNVATGAGYIIAPNFRGGVQSCWDENQNDVACS